MAKGMPNPFWLVTSTSMNQEIINLSSGSSERGTIGSLMKPNSRCSPMTVRVSIRQQWRRHHRYVGGSKFDRISILASERDVSPPQSRKLENTVQFDDKSKVLS